MTEEWRKKNSFDKCRWLFFLNEKYEDTRLQYQSTTNTELESPEFQTCSNKVKPWKAGTIKIYIAKYKM